MTAAQDQTWIFPPTTPSAAHKPTLPTSMTNAAKEGCEPVGSAGSPHGSVRARPEVPPVIHAAATAMTGGTPPAINANGTTFNSDGPPESPNQPMLRSKLAQKPNTTAVPATATAKPETTPVKAGLLTSSDEARAMEQANNPPAMAIARATAAGQMSRNHAPNPAATQDATLMTATSFSLRRFGASTTHSSAMPKAMPPRSGRP